MADALPRAVPRFTTERNHERRTLGGEVAEEMADLGSPPMPWQKDALDIQYELDEEATEEASTAACTFRPVLWYRENRLTVPRQSGKTTKAQGRHVHRMRRSRAHGWSARPLSFYMAQTATDAREKLVEDWMEALRESPFWQEDDNGRALPSSPIQQFIRSNGREAIKWLGGGRITVKPPSRTGGHGGSPDLIDLDEAFAHRDATPEQGVRPGMITKESPQLYVVSTAGTGESEYLWGKVDDGRARCETPNPQSRVSYIEYSAYPGATNSAIEEDVPDIDMMDPAVLRRCSPALGFTIKLVNLLADIEGMASPDEARRAYGNIWTTAVARVIPAAAWLHHLRPRSRIDGRAWLAVDATPGTDEGGRRASVSIGGYAGPRDIHLEVIDNRAGLEWVPGRIRELTRAHRNIEHTLYDRSGPIRAIEPDIKLASACPTRALEGAEMAAACQRIHQDILDATSPLVHIGQSVLDAAVGHVAKRIVLDSWTWGRRVSTADISPVVACTEVYWEAVNNPPRRLEIHR